MNPVALRQLVTTPLRSTTSILPSSRLAIAIRVTRRRDYATKAEQKPMTPELFPQTVVLSNGATYMVRTSSPRAQLRLTKDTRNHPLWNPAVLASQLSDENEQLVRFTKRFGDLHDLSDVSVIQSDEAVSAAMTKAVTVSTSPKKAKPKGKK
ncbi:hypothetical protein BC938DRAFT_475383 [Jimgerdemannia flammicorona]|uniref:Ribosomal protein bL31m N-terminal domain-containing protein n=1 Tax=Jimgerdemannia flammicorona TaxID=994334 RepID=A0A433QRP2_9FUNG|nr:hypothetical protein BC938DRAFT_475383 [Jimgerdemannia flammicorona]